MTIKRIRRRRFVRALELAVADFTTGLRSLSLGTGRSGNALQPALR